ncbi:Ig-like domain-containing protein [Polyangium aurulentum]|uniref:Ig-like domain-containing protein n=1 Tax=Polyangium aurulentum TaxID=2567896 RepID=UPI0010AE35FB|nr:Ig-like domain-containing protein [Polyangium aurulentum]UQA57967.1 hypothetical protein E8A73_042980 [Polyangium aurulentum]
MSTASPDRGLLRRRVRAACVLSLLGLAASALAAPSCTTEAPPPATETETLRPGDLCTPPAPDRVRVRFEPAQVFLAPCADGAACPTRKVEVIVDPDICAKTPVRFDSSNAGAVPSPAEASLGLYHASVTVDVKAGATPGSATLTARVPRGDGTDAEASLNVEVIAPSEADVACADAMGTNSTAALKGGDTLLGDGPRAGASIGLPPGADKPNQGSYLWSVAPFEASIKCGTAAPPEGYAALGPAITFGPLGKSFQRDVPLSIPLNPARMPDKARLRHLGVAYTDPAFPTPRIVSVSDARIEKVEGKWALTFKAPRLGTYQAVVREDAGTKTFKRRITHRAVMGVSMGGGGTAMFGSRHHDLFDVLAPLGGPVDWTWLLHNIETHHLGGFRSIAPGTQLGDIKLTSTACATAAECEPDETCLGVLEGGAIPGKCVLMTPPTSPYEHPQTFNQWWAEFPREGNGGNFSRTDYIQIFRDLAVMFGNPNGENLTPGGENLPAGVHPDDKSQTGDHANGECKNWVDPLDGPDKETQEEIANNCPKERCAHTLTLTNYFDDEYNPDGTFPVITVCDGSPQDQARTPYANWWSSGGNDYPLELALAVDYNGNGVRDELEPIIRAGHEPWQDVGTDGVPSAMEPGYAPGVNEDPAGDDYDPQFNPAGTERDHRYQKGEPFQDVGLDGVAGTKQQPAGGWTKPGDGYDVGEGDGKFTMASGLQRFYDRDAHSIVRRMTADVPAGELDDEKLKRVDLWTDGGTRDLFNFGVDAQHLVGSFAARGRGVTYFSDFTQQPGLDPSKPIEFFPARVSYEDLPGIVLQRYGKLDPTAKDIDNGSGQHVGTANELIARLQSALYFIGSRWPEPELRSLVLDSSDDPVDGVPDCEVLGGCAIEFTSKDGRKGPVGISLPPGYAHKSQQDRRYPVIYLLHGYGQEPQDLIAATVLLKTWMNSPGEGMESRLPKAILVYVDGRCRLGPSGKPECIRGTFFGESPMENGAKGESWWLELMEYIDTNYRTMGETEIDWTE